MEKAILFIDGENLIYKIEQVLKDKKISRDPHVITSFNFQKLYMPIIRKYHVAGKRFYAAKLHYNPDTREKSEELIRIQRKLKNTLVKQGFEYIIAGHVRAQTINIGNKTKIVFREKGVDVKIAVDMVSMSANNQLSTALLCSSDSDLQPAVQELRKRNKKIAYVGFAIDPNKGLMFTANHNILFKNSDVLACIK